MDDASRPAIAAEVTALGGFLTALTATNRRDVISVPAARTVNS